MIKKRASIDRYLMDLAWTVSKRSTCTEHHGVGAVASIQGRVVMTGYNGVPSGMAHCDDVGHVRLKDGKHAFLLHAEENIVAQSARFGISLKGADIHITHCPCSHCAAILSQAGVASVLYEASTIPEDEEAWTMSVLTIANIRVYRLKAGEQ